MEKSRVAVVRAKGMLSSDGEMELKRVVLLLEKGIGLASGQAGLKEGLSSLFSPHDRVGIKINCIAGKGLSTRPEVSLSLAGLLPQGGIQQKNVIIWDRTNRELKEAGYRLSESRQSLKIFGTDTEGAGYETELASHLNIGSLLSTIQTNFVTASVSLAILKDHGLAGVTAGMKNYFGAIHNPNKYHDSNCNPYVAEVFDLPSIKKKHRLTILDGLIVQYHRGPALHPSWAEKFEGMIFSLDPVAADYAGWRTIESFRAKKGLPPLREEKREPAYLSTAQRMGLGKANPEEVEIIEDEI